MLNCINVDLNVELYKCGPKCCLSNTVLTILLHLKPIYRIQKIINHENCIIS